MCLLDENKNILFKNTEFKRFFNLPDFTEKDIELSDLLGCKKKDLLYKICDEPDCDQCKVCLLYTSRCV